MVSLRIPPPYYNMFAICIDDSKPPKGVIDWIKVDKIYKVKAMTDALNGNGGNAVIITDNNGTELHPTESMWSFQGDRFQYFTLIMN